MSGGTSDDLVTKGHKVVKADGSGSEGLQAASEAPPHGLTWTSMVCVHSDITGTSWSTPRPLLVHQQNRNRTSR